MNPIPNEPNAAAMAAARHDALCQWACTYASGHTDTGLQDLTMLVENFIQHHFQPLLAKVEGELSTLRTERDIAIDKLLATITALRADLAAAKADLIESRIENEIFRNAQKACEDCDAPMVSEVKQLRAELAAKGEDAARFIWLIEKCPNHTFEEITDDLPEARAQIDASREDKGGT